MKIAVHQACFRNLRIGLIICFNLFFSIKIIAQENFTDSLNREFTEKTDSTKAKVFSSLFYKYQSSDYHRARIAGNMALPYLNQRISKSELAKFYLLVGQTEYTYGNHEKALQLYLESANIGKEFSLPKSEAAAYNEIAVLHRKNKNQTASKTYIQNALNIFKQQNDTIGIATSICNLGITYEIEGNPKQALNYYFEALQLYEYTNIDLGKSYCLDYIAGAYRLLNIADSALYFESKSLGIRRTLDNKYVLAQSLMSMGEIYLSQKKYSEAIKYFEETALICNQIGFIDYERTAYEYLAEANAKLGNYENAYLYKLRFTKLNDSLFNEKRAEQISELETRYQTQKKETEIKSQQLQIQKRNYLLIASSMLVVVVIIASYFWYSRQRLQQQQQREKLIWETEENQRISLAKDIHDDLGSGLSKINFLAQDLIKQIPETFSEKYNLSSITDISKNLIDNMRDLVWQLNAENNGIDNLAARIREYATDYLEDYKIKLSFDISPSLPNQDLSKIKHRQIFLTIKETLHNIVKHSNADLVNIHIITDGKYLTISINDNGIGFDISKKSNGNGVRNMFSRMQNIGADLAINSTTNGSTVTIKLLLSKTEILL